MAEEKWWPAGEKGSELAGFMTKKPVLTITGDAGFITMTKAALGNIDYWPLGKSLFLELYRNKSSNWLKKGIEIVQFGACATRDLDYGPEVNWSWDYINQKADFEPTIGHVRQCQKTYVYLFHELVHVYHMMTGTYSGGRHGSTPAEEFRTVGLYEFRNEIFSENRLRKEVHVWRRPYYYRNGDNDPDGYAEETQRRKKSGFPMAPNHDMRELDHGF